MISIDHIYRYKLPVLKERNITDCLFLNKQKAKAKAKTNLGIIRLYLFIIFLVWKTSVSY